MSNISFFEGEENSSPCSEEYYLDYISNALKRIRDGGSAYQ